MQKAIITILTLAALFISSCNFNNERVTKANLEQLINDALSGDQNANQKLQGFLTSKHIGKKDYNQLYIDQLNTGEKTYYSVILEYYDPRLNLFAIYDDNLNFYLLDKSLNGYLNSEWIDNGTRKFVFVQERFLTRDVLSIDRLSIYEVGEIEASLVYRSMSRFVKVNNLSYQKIESIKGNLILTKITGTSDKALNNKIDTFYFNPTSKKYLSKKNLFDNYVRQEIDNFVWNTTKPQITEDFVDAEIVTVTKNFKISLNRDWQKIPKYTEDKHLKQPLTGVKYVNVNHGSSFIILQIPRGEVGEIYCPYILTETVKGKYRIRASEVFEIGKNYLQIFEHTCGGTKYFLLFECPKAIYLENRKEFSDIINSFAIDC